MTIVLDRSETTREEKVEYIDFTALRPSPTEVDWAQDHLAGLTTLVNVKAGTRVHEWLHQGKVFRSVGIIYVTWSGENPRFRIWLNEDATSSDLDNYRERIKMAQAGWFGERFGWHASTSADVWYYKMDRQITEEGRRALVRMPEPLMECADPACIHDVHPAGDFYHEGEGIEGEHYRLQPSRGENDARWLVNIYVDGDDWSVADIARLVNDLQWVSADVRKLNERLEAGL